MATLPEIVLTRWSRFSFSDIRVPIETVVKQEPPVLEKSVLSHSVETEGLSPEKSFWLVLSDELCIVLCPDLRFYLFNFKLLTIENFQDL